MRFRISTKGPVGGQGKALPLPLCPCRPRHSDPHAGSRNQGAREGAGEGRGKAAVTGRRPARMATAVSRRGLTPVTPESTNDAVTAASEVAEHGHLHFVGHPLHHANDAGAALIGTAEHGPR